MADELKRGITFQVTWEMYKQLRNISKKKDLTVSYLVRKLVRDFLQSEGSIDTEAEGDITRRDNQMRRTGELARDPSSI